MTLRTDLTSIAQYRGAILRGQQFCLGASRSSDLHTSGFQRHLEDYDSESLVRRFSGTLPQSCPILISPPKGSIAPNLTFGHGRATHRSGGTTTLRRRYSPIPTHICRPLKPIFLIFGEDSLLSASFFFEKKASDVGVADMAVGR